MKKKLLAKISMLCVTTLLLGSLPSVSVLATTDDNGTTTVADSNVNSVSGNNSGNVSGGDSGNAGGGFPGGGMPGGGAQDSGTLIEDRILDVVLNVGKTESEISVTWYTNGDADAKLQITKAANVSGGSFPTDASLFTEYKANETQTTYEDYYSNSITLTGLVGGEAYAYRVSGTDEGGNVIWSDIYSYSAENVEDGYSFLVAGDPQIGSGKVATDTEGWIATMAAALGQFSDVSFLLSVGDQVNSASGNSLENEYQGFLAEETLLSSIPFAPTVGNHDNNTITSYVTHNTLPNLSTYGSSNDTVTGDENYSFRYGNTIFMMLNTNNSSIAEHKAFIEESLSNNQDAVWRVVAFHQSIYSVARHVNDGNIAELRTGLSPIFAENNIDVVLMGHDHVYARSYIMGGDTGMVADVQSDEEGNALTEITNPEGVQYVTFNSASGSKYYDITNELFEYTAVQSQEKSPNYSYVTVDEDSFTVTTYRSTDNTVVDTITINKIVEGGIEEPDAEPTEAPTAEPTEAPTAEPTEAPTAEPTVAPTAEPTEAPTATPTVAPTAEPTEAPTATPTTGSTATSASTIDSIQETVVTPITYEVKLGDNLYKIAKMYGLTLKALLELNPQITKPNLIFPGQRIIVGVTETLKEGSPVASTTQEYYTVQKGDCLYKIAKLHNMTLNELYMLNQDYMKRKYIYSGELIRIK